MHEENTHIEVLEKEIREFEYGRMLKREDIESLND